MPVLIDDILPELLQIIEVCKQKVDEKRDMYFSMFLKTLFLI